jgi:hypothetical protein
LARPRTTRARHDDGAFEIEPDVLDWLLEADNPSVRYFVLRDLLDLPPTDAKVRKAAHDIMQSRPVRDILGEQQPEGYWLTPERFYSAKYRGTVWQLLLLAELGADPGDARIRRACEFVLDWSQDRASGGFSIKGSQSGGQHSGVVPCLTGNMIWTLIRFGFGSDPRVREAIDWITTYQRFDDGIDDPPRGWPYDRWEICWGGHTCHMGVVKVLKAFADIPEDERSPKVHRTIARAAEFMLIHHVHKCSHNLDRVSNPGWLRFGFPLMYQTDVLEILNLLLRLGYRDARMDEAVALVASKRDAEGRWALENSYNDRFVTPIERKGASSKWITLNALKALKYRSTPVKAET